MKNFDSYQAANPLWRLRIICSFQIKMTAINWRTHSYFWGSYLQRIFHKQKNWSVLFHLPHHFHFNSFLGMKATYSKNLSCRGLMYSRVWNFHPGRKLRHPNWILLSVWTSPRSVLCCVCFAWMKKCCQPASSFFAT